MEAEGLLKEKTEIFYGTSKAGKAWQKIGFALKVKGQRYPKDMYFETLNPQLIQEVSDTNLDSEIKVYFDAQSRKWNDRWFTSLNAFRIELNKSAEVDAGYMDQENNQRADESNFNNIAKDDSGDDDLPF